MKKLQCPLCGGDITIEKRVLYSDRPLLFHAGCEQCRWETNRGYAAEKDAWKDAEKFVSKFPPIMRVWPGDKLQVEDGSICEVINVNKNLAMMDVRRGEGRPVFTIADTHVIRWPWELEQEGGTEQ